MRTNLLRFARTILVILSDYNNGDLSEIKKFLL